MLHICMSLYMYKHKLYYFVRILISAVHKMRASVYVYNCAA